ncbi:F86 [Hirschfeldia incana]|nr:F86 [Hirschfeldia incana]
MDSFFTGFVHSVGNFFGSPLDFLSGKSCSTLCPSPWDVLCYVENFCVASLAKAALILIVAYLFLFFIYMLYKIGFWHCIIHGFFRFLWTIVSCWFYILSSCCTFFCYDLLHTKRRRRRRNRRYAEDGGDYCDEDTDDGGSFRYHRSRREMRKEERLRKSLRPRSHRVRVGVRKEHPTSDSGLSQHHAGGGGVGPVDGIRVSRESKFARKGSKRRARGHHGPPRRI